MRIIGVMVLTLLPSLALARDHADAARHEMIRGNYAAAETLLRQSIAGFYGDPRARFDLASTLRERGKPQEALKEFAETLKLTRPDDKKMVSDSLYGIALTRDGMSDPIASAAAWDEYISFARNIPEDQAALAIARTHHEEAQRLAGIRRPPGTQKAGR